MYRKPHVNQLAFEDFVLPFGGKLRGDNRWVLLAKQIPWAVVDTAYAQQFSHEDLGSPAKASFPPRAGGPHPQRTLGRHGS